MIPPRLVGRLQAEGGAVTVIAALLMVVIMASMAFALDLARLRHERQLLQTAVDLGALAGAGKLPVQGSAEANMAVATARRVALGNAPQLAGATLDISFRCVVTDPEGNGGADSPDVRFACGPDGGGGWFDGWSTRRGRAYHACDPFSGEKCNTIVLRASNFVKYFFAPVIGIRQGSTGAVNGASCKGFCGQPSSPLDVVMVLDRTGSMTQSDVANVKNAALSILDFYDSSEQWVGLVALPYGQPGNKCIANHPQLYPNSNMTTWQNVPISNNYSSGSGGLNTSSALVRGVNCLLRAPISGDPRPYGPPGTPVLACSDSSPPCTSGNHTNLGDPLDAARAMLAAQGRADVPDVIIFETDGQANQPSTRSPCSYFNTKATTAKAAGVTIFSLAYGLDSPPVRCTDSSGAFRNVYATTNLAGVATNSNDDLPGGCATSENTDGDNYFCVPGSSDLEPIFRAAAVAALTRARLIDI
jgi:hypothetical protein